MNNQDEKIEDLGPITGKTGGECIHCKGTVFVTQKLKITPEPNKENNWSSKPYFYYDNYSCQNCLKTYITDGSYPFV